MKIKTTKHINGFYKIKINNIVVLYNYFNYAITLDKKYNWINGDICDYIPPETIFIIYNKYDFIFEIIMDHQLNYSVTPDIILNKIFSWIKNEDNQNIMKNTILEFEKNISKQIQKKEKELELLNKFKEKFEPFSLEEELSLIKDSEYILDILS